MVYTVIADAQKKIFSEYTEIEQNALCWLAEQNLKEAIRELGYGKGETGYQRASTFDLDFQCRRVRDNLIDGNGLSLPQIVQQYSDSLKKQPYHGL